MFVRGLLFREHCIYAKSLAVRCKHYLRGDCIDPERHGCPVGQVSNTEQSDKNLRGLCL